MSKRKNAFTLVELLAVIVILAVILVIAVPKVISIIDDTKKGTLASTAKLIASSAEKAKVQNQVLGKDIKITCDSVAKLNSEDYERCHIEFDSKNKAHVDIKGSGKFENMYVCKGTKDEAHIVDKCPNEKVMVELQLNTEEEFNDISGIYKEGDVLYLDTPTKQDFTFLGWEVVSGDSVLEDGNKLTVGEFDTIVYAVWENNSSFEVILDGGVDNVEYNERYQSGTIIELEEPTKESYKFVKWELVEGNGVLSGNTFTMGTEKTVIKAIWELNVFSLTVEPNGGIVTQEFKNEYAVGETITLETPTRIGYTFTGWTASSGTIEDNIFTMGNSVVTLTANWKANAYTINYELDGGTNVTENPASGVYGSTIEISNPTRTGYTFVGWTASSGLLSGNSLTIGAGDIILTANWEAKVYTINYELNGGTNAAGNPTSAKYGSTLTIDNPTRTGYTFTGWSVLGTGAVLSGTSLTIGSSDITLTAKWEANTYTVTQYYFYNYLNSEWKHFDTRIDYVKYGESFSPYNIASPTGYYATNNFNYYSGTHNDAGFVGSGTVGTDSITVNNNMYVNVHYYPNTYYFDVNVLNADGGQPWQTCEAGTFEMSVNGGTYTRICNETGEHYPHGTVINFRNFSPGTGRYLSNVTGATNSGGVWTVTITGENVVEFKTGWNTYGISYNLNGGTNASGNPTSGAYGSTITVNNPTRTGYTFTGWSYSGTGAILSGTNLTIGVGDVILTANWTPNTYTLTFNANGGSFDSIYTTVGQSTYSVPITGSYKLEVWGAQGGTYNSTYSGGYGGYSVGTISLNSGTTLYVNVGGAGSICGGIDCTVNGGYNGGGAGRGFSACGSGVYAGSGGGATHISTVSGQLSSLSQYAGNNSSPILIVAGGGGAGNYCNGSNYAKGGSGGGNTGVTSGDLGAKDFTANGGYNATGGTQSSGYSFGLGGGLTSDSNGSVGGGGGYYGGRNSTINGAGGGSGYIANNSLTSKAMYCYSCSTSSTASTLTYSTTNVSSNPTANYAKSGSGAAKITMLSNSKTVTNTSTYGSLPTPTRSNYTFVGWNTKSDGTGTTISSSSTVNLSGNITLYAKWSKPIEVGDCVSYTPSSNSYTTDTAKTGYSSTQTINPSELNLWRVLKINSDGSMDIISHYVSSTAVYFHGNVGYNNYIGYLNVLASQYQTSGITVKSRHFGYSNQTEYDGGADTGYQTDYNLVQNVLGTRVAYGVNAKTTAQAYWLASRYGEDIVSENNQYANARLVRYIKTNGDTANNGLFQYYCYYGECWWEYWSKNLPIRPIVTLKAGLQYSGDGSSASPWKIAS